MTQKTTFAERARARRRAAVARAQVREVPNPDPSFALAISKVRQAGYNPDPYSGHATVYRCVRTIVGAAISAPLVAKKGQKPNGTILETGPWSELLSSPNPIQTRREFVEAFLTWLELDGEVGLYLEGEAGPCRIDEIPKEIWPSRSASDAEPIMDEGSRTILGWKIRSGTKTVEVPEASYVLIRFFNPQNPVRGLSPISAAATGLRTDQKAAAWGEGFFDNSAEPGTVLSTEGALTPDQRREMREAWEARHQGVSRAHRVAVLEGGLKVERTGISQRDMEYLEQRKFGTGELAKVFGVPKFFLMEDADYSFASTRQHKRALWELTVLPLVATIEDVFEARIVKTRDPGTWLEFDRTQVEALRDDLDANLGAAERLTRLGYPLNQANERLELGMPRQPWGDTSLLPMGVAPAESVVAGTDLLGGGLGPIEVDDGEGDPDPLPQQDKPQETTAVGAKAEPIRISRGPIILPGSRETSDDARARRSASWRILERGVLRPATGKFRRRIEGYMNGRRAETLRFVAGLAAARGYRADESTIGGEIEAFLAESEERWRKMIVRQTRPLYRELVQAAANGISKDLGGLAIFSMGDPSIGRLLAEKEVLVQNVPSTIVRALRENLIQGVLEREDLGTLQERIAALSDSSRNVFRAGRNRTLTIARTEVSQATNGARHVVMKAEGVEESEWLTADDEFVRDETGSKRLRPKANHRALDGQVAPLDSTFVPGIMLAHPGDVRAPSWWVVNCRCGAAPRRRKR